MGYLGLQSSLYRQNVSLVLANRKPTARFKYLKFLPLNDTQAIMCIVTDDGAMDNGLIDIPAGMSGSELDYLSGKMSNLLEGRRLTEITGDLLQEVYSAVSEDEVMLASLKKAIGNIAAKNSEQKVFLGGAKQLLNQPEFRDPDKAHALMNYLSDASHLTNLPAADSFGGDVKMLIGPENIAEELKNSSVILAKYDAGDGMQGVIGVVGPTRMDYAAVAAKLSYIAAGLSRLLAGPDAPEGLNNKLVLKETNDHE